MSAIDIGPGATDRGTYNVPGVAYTYIELANPANATGKITSYQIYVYSNLTAVKMVTFTVNGGDATKYTPHDVETIGNITSGGTQPRVFTGLDCDVTVGDYLGTVWTTGGIEADTSGSGVYYKAGDQSAAGEQTYTFYANFTHSVYGEGTTPGWANITKVNGIASASISKVNGIAVASISKVNGIAV